MSQCANCSKPIGSLLNVRCNRCEKTFHRKCAFQLNGKALSVGVLKALQKTGSAWWCVTCFPIRNDPLTSVPLPSVMVDAGESPTIAPVNSTSPVRRQQRRRKSPLRYSPSAPTGFAATRCHQDDLEFQLNELSISESQLQVNSVANDEANVSYQSDGERTAPVHEVSRPNVFKEKAEKMIIPEHREWSILLRGTNKGKPLLVTKRGERFAINNHSSNTTWHWGCTHRSGKNGSEPCRARVSQKVSFKNGHPVLPSSNADHADRRALSTVTLDSKLDQMVEPLQSDFIFRGHHPELDHNHELDPGTEERAKIVRDAKDLLRSQPFEPIGNIVDQVKETLQPGNFKECYVADNLLARRLHRDRAKVFPKIDMSDPDYKVDLSAIKDGELFHHEVVWAGTGEARRRHDVFMTKYQRHLAASCERLYLDGTFKMAPKGYMQLLSINGFLESESGDLVQVPLGFAFMKRRRAIDYKAVLSTMKGLLMAVSVKEFVSDFEQGIWAAIRQVFPGASHFGCSFHWKQAVLRKVREHGHGTAYLQNGPIREAVQRLLCLPYLPENKIPLVFDHLKATAPLELERLFSYVENTWITSSKWPPRSWSVFQKAIRTNNDCEGIHNRWNGKANGKKGFYWILSQLVKESKRIPLQATLLSHGLIKRRQKNKTKQKEGLIFDLWQRYTAKDGAMSSLDLLDKFVPLLRSNFPQVNGLSNIPQDDQRDEEWIEDDNFDPYCDA